MQYQSAGHSPGLRRLSYGLVAVMLFAIVARAGAFAGEAPMAGIKTALLPPFPFYWPIYVAQEKGIFKDQRLNVEVVQLSRPSEAVQALVGGSVNFAWVSADAFINAIEAGGNVAIVGQAIGNPGFSVIAQPAIKTWAEVKGKTVAVSAPKDGAAIIFRLMAQANGLKEGDYTFISVGTTPNRYAALKSRTVDVTIILAPQDFMAINEGFQLLGRSDAILKNYAFIMIGTNKDWAAKHGDEVRRYLAGVREAIEWLYEPANKNDSLDILLKAMRKAERGTMEKIYSMYFQQGSGRIVTRGVEVDMEGLRIYGDVLKELDLLKGTPEPKKWVDLSYLKSVSR